MLIRLLKSIMLIPLHPVRCRIYGFCHEKWKVENFNNQMEKNREDSSQVNNLTNILDLFFKSSILEILAKSVRAKYRARNLVSSISCGGGTTTSTDDLMSWRNSFEKKESQQRELRASFSEVTKHPKSKTEDPPFKKLVIKPKSTSTAPTQPAERKKPDSGSDDEPASGSQEEEPME